MPSHHLTRRASLAAACLGAACLVLAACGGSSPSQATTASETPAPGGPEATANPAETGVAADVCQKLTMDAMLAAVGGTNPQGTKTFTDNHSDCAYTLFTPSSSGPVGWEIDVQVWDPSQWDYQLGLPSDNRVQVSGLGDAAFADTSVGERSLWVKRGSLLVSVTAPDHEGAADLEAKVAALALQTFP
jgi:hypothetical protein